MLKYAQMFADNMTSKEIKYNVKDDRCITVGYNGENLRSIKIFVLFDEDSAPMAQLICWEIASFKGKEEKGLNVCNELNSKFRWVKFYLDSDQDLRAEMDLRFTDESCGELCTTSVLRMVSVIDNAYPSIGKALWA